MPFSPRKFLIKCHWQNTQLGKNFDYVERSSTEKTCNNISIGEHFPPGELLVSFFDRRTSSVASTCRQPVCLDKLSRQRLLKQLQFWTFWTLQKFANRPFVDLQFVRKTVFVLLTFFNFETEIHPQDIFLMIIYRSRYIWHLTFAEIQSDLSLNSVLRVKNVRFLFEKVPI